MIYRCKEAFSTRVGGVKRVVPAGELVNDGDPVIQGRKNLFEPAGDYVSRRGASGVERTTAEPEEKRSVTPAAPSQGETPKRGPGRPRKPRPEGEGKSS